MTDTLLVRLKPYDPRRGFVLRRFTYAGIRFQDERGWYRVERKVGEHLRAVRTVPTDKYAPLAFDVCTEAEAKALDAGESEAENETLRRERDAECQRAAQDFDADDQSRASCPKVDPASEGDDETDIIITGRQVPFVQVGMIVHPDDCLNCERDGSPLWCSALVCDIHDDDETARFGMMATLLFRNGERREEPCDELRRRWRLARDFDQSRVYTGRWGAIPRGSVWPAAEVNEDA